MRWARAAHSAAVPLAGEREYKSQWLSVPGIEERKKKM